MPTVLENQTRWTEHQWDREGHEWSPGRTAAGGEMLWWRGLLPRVATHLPAGRILEIGPGFGRWTQHLVTLCNRLDVVDLTERCIVRCRERFGDRPGFAAWVNDGQSLDMVPDDSLDFVFSFDSLVHAEAPELKAYIHQLAQKLKPGGTGFLHHSNLAAFAGAEGQLPAWVNKKNWRAESMSARLFREYCREAGLHCRSQEIINWVGRSRRWNRHPIPGAGVPLTDVLSTFCRPDPDAVSGQGCGADPTRVYPNHRFVEEWRQMVTLADIYGRHQSSDAAEAAPGRPTPDLLTRVSEGVARRADHASSLLRDRINAGRVRRHEPILNRARSGRCPDCGGALSTARECRACAVVYLL